MADEDEEFEFRLRAEQEAAPKAERSGPIYPEGFQPKRPNTWDQKVGQTGEKFEKAAGTGLKGLGRTVVAAGESALAMGSGIVGDVAGAMTALESSAAGVPAPLAAAEGEKVRSGITYEPRTEAGKAGLEHIGALASPVTDLMAKPVKALERAGQPVLAQTARAAMDVAPIKVPKALQAAREVARPAAESIAAAGEAKAAARAAQEAPKNEVIRRAQTLGIRFTPGQAGGAVGKLVQGVSGASRLEMEVSIKNAPAVNKAAAADVGVTEKESLPQSLPKKVAEANQKYQAVRDFGKVDLAADAQYKQALGAVRDRTSQEGVDFPEDLNEAVEKEIRKFDVPSANANSMMTKIIKLRQRATRNIKTGDAEKTELGFAQKRIANAMEDALERHGEKIGRGEAVNEFRQARRQLAKIHTIDEALSPSGNVSARSLAKALERGEPLDGNMRTIAETYQIAEKSLRDVDKLGDKTGPFTVVDYLVGVGGAMHNPALAAAVLARPVTRAVLSSKAGQRLTVGPKTVRPSITSRVARKIAGPRGKAIDAPPQTLQSLQESSEP